jgi:hypothetical protein
MTGDVLATTRRPPIQAAGRRQRLAQLVGAVVAFAIVLALSLGRGESGPEEGVFAPDGPSAVRILVLGDSSAGRGSCAGCPVYGEQIAEAVRRDGRAAYLDDRTWSTNAWPSANLAGMTGVLRADPAMSGMVAGADLIVLAMGVYDVGLVDGTRCQPPAVGVRAASYGPGTQCNRQGVREVQRRLDGLFAEITRLRRGRPVEMRLVTPPPVHTVGAHPGRNRHRADQRARNALERLAAVECAKIAGTGGFCVDLGQVLQDGAVLVDDKHFSRQILSADAHDIVAHELLAHRLV